MHADTVQLWHEGKCVARHERCYSRQQKILDLEHYLDVLRKKPGALAGSTPLAQWRLARRWPESHPRVGCAGFFIDMAVVDPSKPGRYLIGIECDGAAYHSARSARERDRLRGFVLQGLGWKLHSFGLQPGSRVEIVRSSDLNLLFSRHNLPLRILLIRARLRKSLSM